MAKGKQTYFGMYCQEVLEDGTKCGYQTKTISRNKANIPQGEKMRVNMYCPRCKKHTEHLAKPEKK